MAETTVALALTLIVLSGAIEMLNSSTVLVGTSRVISETNHGLQAAMSLMTRDLIQTGQGMPLGGVPVPTGGGALAILRPGPTANLTFPALPTLPSLSPGADLGPTLLGVQTDIVTLFYRDQTLSLGGNLQAIAANGSTMTVVAGAPVTGVGGLVAGDLIWFNNNNGDAIQMVTTTPTSQVVQFAASDPLRFNQRTAPQGTILNLRNTNGTFPPTSAARVLMITYFIDRTTDPDLPRLVRQVNNGQRLAIAMGVENLQFTYDLVDGVTNPTNVTTPAAGNSPNQIRKVNIFLSARSQDVNPQTKQFFRNSLTTQVGLRSLSFVNRYD
jgi:hypothetical protein